MGTRSGIGYVTENGTVKSVYCHYDGYPDWNGKLLTTYYNSLDDAKAIVALGSLSGLNKRLNPIGKHSFDMPELDTTIAYHRDRCEDLAIEEYPDVVEYLVDIIDDYCADFGYFFTDNKWYCYDLCKKEFVNLY